ncbi:hypothetical protein NGRA_3280 [Nosema granulosis]|uniref:Uncharacterized protein n=1 Tax=Nosema granulosis TaxID=83296 RepID=A0A9P6KXD0_9MICR|nr:hypothetical protein NGRA_3280 [Nosema granulosis]
MSQVEEDRKTLREYKINKNENNISYIGTFLKYKTNESTVIKKKISSLSTINILFSVHEGFKKINKDFYKKLDSIKKVLIVREDLTSSLIELIERIDVVYDDLYTWYPGLKYSDPWSFFIELVPNIIYDYKNYYTRSLLVGEKPKEKILDVLRNRMSKSLIDFDIINKDMFIFNMKDNSEVKRSKKLVKNIVSENYWTEDDKNIENGTLDLIGVSTRCIKYNKDIVLEINNNLTIIELEINSKLFRLSLVEFNDLLNNIERSKQSLINLKIIVSEWNVVC